MDYRKHFVTAMYAVADMDQILKKMDEVFTEYHQLVIAKTKGKIDNDYFIYQIQDLGQKRKLIFKKYETVSKQIEEIKQEFGGQVKR